MRAEPARETGFAAAHCDALSRFRALPLQRAMAAAAFAEVLALSGKAQELYMKSHYERCTEKWRAALAAAEAIGAEDCVLVAAIRMEVARSLFACESAQLSSFSQAFVLKQLDVLGANAATLRRRRDAGTLMEGKCRPIETQWYSEYMTYMASGRSQEKLDETAAFRRDWVKLVGYEIFLDLCCGCMTLVCSATASMSGNTAGNPSAVSFRSSAMCVTKRWRS